MNKSLTHPGATLLRNVRVSAGYSQEGLAAACECKRSRLQRIETGRGYVVLTEELAARIAAELSVSPGFLFGSGHALGRGGK